MGERDRENTGNCNGKRKCRLTHIQLHFGTCTWKAEQCFWHIADLRQKQQQGKPRGKQGNQQETADGVVTQTRSCSVLCEIRQRIQPPALVFAHTLTKGCLVHTIQKKFPNISLTTVCQVIVLTTNSLFVFIPNIILFNHFKISYDETILIKCH